MTVARNPRYILLIDPAEGFLLDFPLAVCLRISSALADMPGVNRPISNGVNSQRQVPEDDDDPDIEPLSPEEIRSLFTTRHGRRFHSHGTQAVPYPLPCDDAEIDVSPSPCSRRYARPLRHSVVVCPF